MKHEASHSERLWGAFLFERGGPMEERKPLTERQERFCQEYTVHYEGKRAAIAAGYAEKTAAKTACLLLKDDRIKARIREIQAETLEHLFIDRTKMILELMDVVEICKAAKPVMIWDYSKHKMVPSGEYQIDAKNALKGLEMIGRYLGLDKQESRTDSGPVFYSGEEEIKE